MQSGWYQALFPHVTALLAKATKTEFTTAQGGSRYSTSSGATLTGRGAQMIILDDPQKSDDAQSDTKRKALHEWFRNTVYTRLNNRRDGAIILVMQRLHLDDLAGHLRQRGDWRALSLPAIAPGLQQVQVGPDKWHCRRTGDLLHPEREPQTALDDIRQTMGGYNFSAQYLQQPVPIKGELVKWGWFIPFKNLPNRNCPIVQSWDVAIKGEQIHEYSVCTTWAVNGRDYYLLDVFRARMQFPDLRRQVTALAGHWRATTIFIEEGQRKRSHPAAQ